MKKLIIALSLLLSFGASADVKITGLPLGSGADVSDTDVLPYVDVSAGVTKKLKLADMVNIPAFIDAFPELAGPLTASKVVVTDSSAKLVSSSCSATQVGYLSSATGTTGTGNVVFSASPTFSGASIFPGSTTITSAGNLGVRVTSPTVAGTVPQTNNSQIFGSLRLGGASTSVNDDALLNLSTYGYLSSDEASTPVILGWNLATKNASGTVTYTPQTTTGFGYSAMKLGVGGTVDFYTSAANTTGGATVSPTSRFNIDSNGSASFTGGIANSQSGADAYVQSISTTDGFAAYMKLVGHNSAGASFNGVFSDTNAGTEYWYVGGAGVANSLSLRAGGFIGETLNSSGALTLPAYGLGVLHSSSGGAITSSSVVNADIANSTIDLTTKVTGILPNANTTGAVTNNVATLVLRDPTTGGFSAGPIVASLTGNVTGNVSGTAASFTGNLTGDVTSVAMATTLATVNSNVGSFGSSTSIPSITVNGKGLVTAASGNPVIAPAGTLTGATLAANVLASSLTSVGTLATGVWNGTAVDATHGGTNQTTWATGDLLYASGSNTLAKRTVGSSGNVLTVSGGVPTWAAPATAGTVTSVAMTVPTFLSIGGSPVTSSGTLAVTLSGTALPVPNGGTGTTTSTGSGNTVLSTTPSFGTSVLPDTNYAIGAGTDIGSSSFVWKDLYLGHQLIYTGVQPSSVGTTPGTAATAPFSITAAVGGTSTIATTGAGGPGADVLFTTGAGGVASSATTASTGGFAGTAGFNGATGGAAAVAGTGTNTGGLGSQLNLLAGTGGAATGATSGANLGGNAGLWRAIGGTGGAASGSSLSNTGGTGNDMRITGGAGGAATSAGTTNTGGAGATVSLTTGTGGAASGGTSNTGGAGGIMTFAAQSGGAGSTAAGADGYFLWKTQSATDRMRLDANGDLSVGLTAPFVKTAANTYVAIKGNASGGFGVLELSSPTADAQNNKIGNLTFSDTFSTATEKRAAVIEGRLTGTTATLRGSELRFFAKVDNSSPGSLTELLNLSGTNSKATITGSLGFSGTAPTMGACGTSPSISGNDTSGTITVGTGGTATTCAVTFAATKTSTPKCFVNDVSDTVVPYVSARSTTAFTITKLTAFAASASIDYFCVQ